MTAPPALSVVVVNWNSGPYLGLMLGSLGRHPPSVPYEVVVVDNASSDGSAEAAASAVLSGGCATLIRNSRNLGLAAANNQGLAATTGDCVLICNPDVELTAGALDALMAVMQRHQRASIVVPRLAHPDGAPQTSAGDLPRLSEALAGRRLARLLARRRSSGDPRAGFWWDDWDHADEVQIGRGAEACYLVRREAVNDVGPQDPAYRLDWEGIEWTARMRREGWEVWLAPDAVVRHAGGASISRARLRWVAQSHLGMYRYFGSRLPRPVRIPLALAIGLRALGKAAAGAAGLPLYRWAQHGPADTPSVGPRPTGEHSRCG